jgi:hypothetical protein
VRTQNVARTVNVGRASGLDSAGPIRARLARRTLAWGGKANPDLLDQRLGCRLQRALATRDHHPDRGHSMLWAVWLQTGRGRSRVPQIACRILSFLYGDEPASPSEVRGGRPRQVKSKLVLTRRRGCEREFNGGLPWPAPLITARRRRHILVRSQAAHTAVDVALIAFSSRPRTH